MGENLYSTTEAPCGNSSVVLSAHPFITAILRNHAGIPHISPISSYFSMFLCKIVCRAVHMPTQVAHSFLETGKLQHITESKSIAQGQNQSQSRVGFKTYFILKKNIHLHPETGTGGYIPAFLVFCWLLLGLKKKEKWCYAVLKHTHTRSFFFPVLRD